VNSAVQISEAVRPSAYWAHLVFFSTRMVSLL